MIISCPESGLGSIKFQTTLVNISYIIGHFRVLNDYITLKPNKGATVTQSTYISNPYDGFCFMTWLSGNIYITAVQGNICYMPQRTFAYFPKGKTCGQAGESINS